MGGGRYLLGDIQVKTPADVAEIRRRIEKLATTQPTTAPATQASTTRPKVR
jgi:hypothetical protein